MVKLYVKQIKAGKISLNDVPDKWKEAVRHALED